TLAGEILNSRVKLIHKPVCSYENDKYSAMYNLSDNGLMSRFDSNLINTKDELKAMVDKIRPPFPPEWGKSKKIDKTESKNDNSNRDSEQTYRNRARRGGVWLNNENKASLEDNPIHRLPNENPSNSQKQSHETRYEAIDKFIHNSLTSFRKSA